MDNSVEFCQSHPHPLIGIDSERKIVQANPSAQSLFGPGIVGRSCCDVLFGKLECGNHCLTRAQDEGYCVQQVSGLRSSVDTADEHYMTVFPHEEGGCHLAVHPLPQLFERARATRAVINKIIESKTIDDVLIHFREFLTSNEWHPAYRVRDYETDRSAHPMVLKCKWHDERERSNLERPYVSGLAMRTMRRSSPEGKVSFCAIDHFQLLLVLRSEKDVEAFNRLFQTRKNSNELWVVESSRFSGLAMYVLEPNEATATIFEDEEQEHCWLDIPFGQRKPLRVFRKMSVTPHKKQTHFSLEEMEEIVSLHAVANTQIENILSRERETKLAKLDSVHEMSQPAFTALTSIEWLRKKDRENNRGPNFDKEAFYIKKNVEAAIRLVTFLNDSPLISREKPGASFADKVNLLSGVVAPIVNMFRHEEYLKERQHSKIPLASEHLNDLYFNPDGKEVKWEFRTKYTIQYDPALSNLCFYVNVYRLQQIFYNLFSNASKFRSSPDEPLQMSIKVTRQSELSEKDRNDYSNVFPVDVTDQGIGIPEDEEEAVFGLGVRGTGTDQIRGTGRGLYFVRETMLSIGGDVVVFQRKDPTCIRLLFPVSCKDSDWCKENILNSNKVNITKLRNQIILDR